MESDSGKLKFLRSRLEKMRSRVADLGSWLHFFLLNTFWIFGAAFLFFTAHFCIESYTPAVPSDSPIVQAVKHLPREIALALLIAWVLAFSIEYWNRRRHESLSVEIDGKRVQMLRDISAGVFSAVYGRDVPQPVFQQFNKHVIESPFLRTGFDVELKVERVKAPASDQAAGEQRDRAKITMRQVFSTSNLTDKDEEWATNMTVDERLFGQSPAERLHFRYFEIQVFNAEGEKVPDQCKEYSVEPTGLQTQIDNIVRSEAAPGGSESSFQVLRHKARIPRRGRAVIDLIYCQLHATDGGDTMVTRHPAESLKVSIVVPKEDFDVMLMSLHPEDEVCCSRPDEVVLRKYEIRHALLPGQGIYYRWSPRSPEKPEPQ